MLNEPESSKKITKTRGAERILVSLETYTVATSIVHTAYEVERGKPKHMKVTSYRSQETAITSSGTVTCPMTAPIPIIS